MPISFSMSGCILATFAAQWKTVTKEEGRESIELEKQYNRLRFIDATIDRLPIQTEAGSCCLLSSAFFVAVLKSAALCFCVCNQEKYRNA